MGKASDPPDPDDWQPATSRPGELYTPEGQIRSTRNFVSGVGLVAVIIALKAIF